MHVESYVDRLGDGKGRSRRLGAWIAGLAGRQHGMVARRQLVGLGAGEDEIDGWLGCRRLVAIHRGVYAVGHRPLTVEARWMAAVLAGGAGAVLSHASAADLWGLTGLSRPHSHVTVRASRRHRAGITFHQAALPKDEISETEGIQVTTVARTLIDFSATTSRARLAQAMSRGERRLLGDCPSLIDLLERYPRRRGLANIRSVLAENRLGFDISRSEFETRFLEFLDDRDLPRPQVNAIVDAAGRRYEVDCLWRPEGLLIELDSRKHHAHSHSFETDRARDLALVAAGFRIARVTWRRLHREADDLAAELLAALSSSPTFTASGTANVGVDAVVPT